VARTIAEGRLNGNSTKKEKEKHIKTEIEDESVVPTQTKKLCLFKIRRIRESCVGVGEEHA
jgi:hypothetical protein